MAGEGGRSRTPARPVPPLDEAASFTEAPRPEQELHTRHDSATQFTRPGFWLSLAGVTTKCLGKRPESVAPALPEGTEEC